MRSCHHRLIYLFPPVEEFILLGDPSLKIGGYEGDDDNSVSISSIQSNLQINQQSSKPFVLSDFVLIAKH